VKPIRWMKHARDNLRDRGLSPAWAEAAIRAPDWTAPDPNDPAVERRFAPWSAGSRSSPRWTDA